MEVGADPDSRAAPCEPLRRQGRHEDVAEQRADQGEIAVEIRVKLLSSSGCGLFSPDTTVESVMNSPVDCRSRSRCRSDDGEVLAVSVVREQFEVVDALPLGPPLRGRRRDNPCECRNCPLPRDRRQAARLHAEAEAVGARRPPLRQRSSPRQAGVIVPNSPSDSSFGPAVKKRVPGREPALPNSSAQSPSITSFFPSTSRSVPLCSNPSGVSA